MQTEAQSEFFTQPVDGETVGVIVPRPLRGATTEPAWVRRTLIGVALVPQFAHQEDRLSRSPAALRLMVVVRRATTM